MLRSRLCAYLSCTVSSLVLGAVSFMPVEAIAGSPCVGAPTSTETKCLTAVQIPGNPLLSFDISWVNPDRAEMYFADRSNNGVEVIDTKTLKFKRRLGGFVGVVLNGSGTVNNALSGPDGVRAEREQRCRQRIGRSCRPMKTKARTFIMNTTVSHTAYDGMRIRAGVRSGEVRATVIA